MRFWIYDIATRKRACPHCGEPNKFVTNQKICNKCIYKKRTEISYYKKKFQY